MIHVVIRRSTRRRIIRVALLVTLALCLLDLLSLSWTLSREINFVHPHALKSIDGRVFIASTHWNNEAILRSHWNSALLDLVKHVGPLNVYVSVYESGSWDDSKGALRELDGELGKLGAPRKIVLDDTTHGDEIKKPAAATGWVDTPRGRRELRRIPYLSSLRNLSLKPLEDMASQGIFYDKILFLNDVVFTVDDVRALVATRDGDYATACALDFARPPLYYDTFALRDSNGDEPVAQTYPYFRSSSSRNAMMASQPVPLQSCWNGMVVADAAPFYGRTRKGGHFDPPLRFRGVSDSLAKYHLEASECCLIHFDNPMSSERGVWMNPLVRVAYNPTAHKIVASTKQWPSASERLRGIWHNRLARWSSVTWYRRWKVVSKLSQWQRRDKSNQEPGAACLIDEMQVLVHNGWAHV